jgi:ABC-2 type transport system permease protein
MKKLRIFSMARFRAMLAKEFIQMRRDRLTFAMMVGIPLLQLILFGYAINADPKHLPAAVLVADHGPEGQHSRSLQNAAITSLSAGKH